MDQSCLCRIERKSSCAWKALSLMGQVYVCKRKGQGLRCDYLELVDDRGGASEWRLCKRADQLKC